MFELWINAYSQDSKCQTLFSTTGHNRALSVHSVISCSLSVFQMGGLISAGFIVSWAPYVTVSLWTMFHSEGKDSVAPVVSLLPCLFAKCSTVFNPFVYYIFRRSFRRELRQIWTRCGRRSAAGGPVLCGGGRPAEEPANLQKQERAEKWKHGGGGQKVHP